MNLLHLHINLLGNERLTILSVFYLIILTVLKTRCSAGVLHSGRSPLHSAFENFSKHSKDLSALLILQGSACHGLSWSVVVSPHINMVQQSYFLPAEETGKGNECPANLQVKLTAHFLKNWHSFKREKSITQRMAVNIIPLIYFVDERKTQKRSQKSLHKQWPDVLSESTISENLVLLKDSLLLNPGQFVCF